MTGKTTVKSGGHAYSGAYHGIKSGVDYRRTVGSFGHRAVMSPAGLPMPVDKDAPLFAALDVGTNSCRMLIARPNVSGFDVLDAFSKIIYLGSGLEKTGVLSEKAIVRAVEALQVCATKLSYHKVQHTRMITTAPARMAKNGQEFVAQIDAQTGLKLEIVSPEQEARLAAIGCAAHLKVTTEQALIVDIGGGSTELIWIDCSAVPPENRRQALMRLDADLADGVGAISQDGIRVVDWISVPLGIMTLRDQYMDVRVDKDRYALMSWFFEESIEGFAAEQMVNGGVPDNFQIIGTSGTVTTIASTHLRLPRYNRSMVDGQDMTAGQVDAEISRYLLLGTMGRHAEPCIGRNRRDLIMSGAAILQAILRAWPTEVLTIADRGLREGLLYSQMAHAGCLNDLNLNSISWA